tara:strand:- start:2 stop:610 length:609 start_codon:yes stop_codon:yes gene_type:complete
MSLLNVNAIEPSTGTDITLGASGDTITVPSGATIANSGTATGFGLTVADQWRITSDLAFSTAATAQLISANLEQIDADWNDTIGTAMSVSSGIFTFPSTGIYDVQFVVNMYRDNHMNGYCGGQIQATTNDSAYSIATFQYQHLPDTAGVNASVFMNVLIDVDDVANVKVKFMLIGEDSGGFSARGNTSDNSTYMTFKRLGDT